MTKILATDRIHRLPFILLTPFALVMDTAYFLQGIVFEWDENKARSNVRKHGVTFEEAAEVFFDPFYQAGDASMDEEQRDFMVGYTFSQTPDVGRLHRTGRTKSNYLSSSCHS